ncbi:uncharacterized protein METZ01_LOCUS253940 [marine metagenome]|uniref:Lipoprotein n=1 Tax=marine metagenome TaxID=408172 RepID=A0A382INA3_9ZZZZ
MYVRVFLKYFILILLLTGCKSVDDNGRLEKIRIMVPALIDIEFDYYKDKENKGKEVVNNNLTNSAPITAWPKLMPMSRNKN